MTPAARVQSAIGILDSIIDAAQNRGAPADRIIAEWARGNRYAGSKDRRAIRELVYGAIRACGPVPLSGRTAMLRLAELQPEIAELFDGSNYGPPAIGEGEAAATGGAAPPWVVRHLAKSDIAGPEAEALLGRAPLDIRINTLKAARDTIELPEGGEPLLAPNALRYESGTQVEQWDAYRDGKVEVQDHGSQWACTAVRAQPGQTVIDLCAGAGGKTLSLAASMENTGTLIASDTDRGRLSRLAPRAEKAGAGMIQSVLLNPGKELEALSEFQGKADTVLVDAPCSGTGTWRRNPEARWRLGKAELLRFAEIQSRLLSIAAQLVKPGGRIVYVTCSLLDEEGKDRIAAFLAANPGWSADKLELPIGRAHGEGTRLTPYHDGTDGFFIASLTSPC
ncbi:RsmB/NOP family class I SAM-dependent RNA methyltransferase [Altererythrobacter luteolus]|uniref:RsmB/NOP family class I SAM-dependent RNA methyltransferase n=1 Tax=Pontixanthobacter luteolus TaxID=295089 RepID=A0A6I4V3A0_9SPHN|nr:RsmB/NOP family class I SAM-dependent RNA methyltransferase [Pontixanthobacter luteolus]MXP46452.1 RsmB/NOP family class I SAM-dependent RNA methyltransferase [Pontixanthobacter luteolus]